MNKDEWKEYVVQRGEELTLDYLEDISNYPFINGEKAFYDTETYAEHSKRRIDRNPEHLIGSWVVSFQLNGSKLKWKISNKKYVGGWNLENLLWEGTREYVHTGKKGMAFYSRYANKWFFKMHRRKGIPQKFVTAFHELENEAALHGLEMAIKETL